jgi:hypothetical protein
MNDRILFSALIAGSMVAALTLAPMMASAISTIVKAQINGTPVNLNAEIKTDTPIATDGTDGAFGYGVVTLAGLGGTGDSIMVATTHAGVLDSASQATASDPVWHTHYAKLKAAGTYCADTNGPLGRLEVDNLSFDTPGILNIANKNVIFSNMPPSFTSTSVLGTSPDTWNPGTQASLVASFTLNPVTTPDSVFHVCVENVTPFAAGS